MMVALPVSYDASATFVNAETLPKSGQIVRLPKAMLPIPVDDFGASCRKLIEATFSGPSRWDMCETAARHLGCDPKTILRIVTGDTKHPDPRLMFLCLGIYQTKTGKAWPIGGGFEIRITQTAAK